MKPNSLKIQTAEAPAERLTREIMAHPFARDLSRQDVAKLVGCAMETRFEPGETIFREGDQANRFYLLLSGEVALEGRAPGRRAPIEMIGAGEVLGWSWTFPPYHWRFTARAVKPTRAIFFYGTWLREYCEEDHEFGYQMLKRMAQVMLNRLQATRAQLAQLATA